MQARTQASSQLIITVLGTYKPTAQPSSSRTISPLSQCPAVMYVIEYAIQGGDQLPALVAKLQAAEQESSVDGFVWSTPSSEGGHLPRHGPSRSRKLEIETIKGHHSLEVMTRTPRRIPPNVVIDAAISTIGGSVRHG